MTEWPALGDESKFRAGNQLLQVARAIQGKDIALAALDHQGRTLDFS